MLLKTVNTVGNPNQLFDQFLEYDGFIEKVNRRYNNVHMRHIYVGTFKKDIEI